MILPREGTAELVGVYNFKTAVRPAFATFGAARQTPPLKYRKVRKIPVDSWYGSAILCIPRNGGTDSISGVGVLLWRDKPILLQSVIV